MSGLSLAGLYLACSLACFVAYVMDKAAARAGRWRISEKSLLLLGLVGGWPGGLLAQRLLRHKTAKRPFQRAFWCTVVLNLMALAWLLSGLR